MSKKIAEGIGGLVLDVKTGDGAFMKTRGAIARAGRLARRDRRSVRRSHRGADHPDGRAARPRGRQRARSDRVDRDAQGPRPARSRGAVGAARGADARRGGRRARRRRQPKRACATRSRSGAGVEKFREMIAHQGGDPRVVDDYSRLPSAPDRARRHGAASRIRRRRSRAELIGRAAVALGAGREPAGRRHRSGRGHRAWWRRPGDRVAAGEPVLDRAPSRRRAASTRRSRCCRAPSASRTRRRRTPADRRSPHCRRAPMTEVVSTVRAGVNGERERSEAAVARTLRRSGT